MDVRHLEVNFGPLEVDFRLDGEFMLLGVDFTAHEPRGVDIWSLRINLGPLGVYVGHIGVKFEPLRIDFGTLRVEFRF